MAALHLRQYGFRYAASQSMALEGIDLDVEAGRFLLICGRSGSGKSTLLRSLKPEISPVGEVTGEIRLGDTLLRDLPPRMSASKLGHVPQDPRAGLVTDKVWRELAFGLENLGLEGAEIRRRVAETARFFGIDHWFHRDTSTLSSGETQILNLASILVMRPDWILLDEPLSRLDPMAMRRLLDLLQRLNQETGMGLIVAEQRVEELLPLADEVLLLENGRAHAPLSPRAFAATLPGRSPQLIPALPAATRLAHALDPEAADYPLTVREGRAWLAEQRIAPAPIAADTNDKVAGETRIAGRGLWFHYGADQPFVLSDLSLDLRAGEVHALLGANGSGKSTLLGLLAGVRKPSRGKLTRSRELQQAWLPAEARLLLSELTIGEAWARTRRQAGTRLTDARAIEILEVLELTGMGERQPGEISGGEQQRAALAAVLFSQADLLLLDEPTRSLDAPMRLALIELLRAERARGAVIFMATHDLDFAAQLADRCSMLFDGELLVSEPTRDFLRHNLFYTTALQRICHDRLPDLISDLDLVRYRRAGEEGQ